jgi:hypothetical protein
VEGEDVRMGEVSGGADFGKEPLRSHYSSQFGPQDLEGYLPVVLQVLGQIDRSHSATTNLPLDLIAVSECGLKAFLMLHVG